MNNADKIVSDSLTLADRFAAAYKLNPSSDETQNLLEQYRDTRRMLDFGSSGKRPASTEAYARTQGSNIS